MTITYHHDMIQGSEAWHAARCGMLTASELDRILTPTLKVASNDKSRSHLWELAAQRISQYVEPAYVSDAMLRGEDDEIAARDLYRDHYAPVSMCGFVTNDRWGFTLGCSPDGLVGDDGMIECKSRMQKYQVQTIVENLGTDGGQTIPPEFALQVQCSLLVTEREWCDFISYSGGLPLAVIRVESNEAVQAAILNAAEMAEYRIKEIIGAYGRVAKQLIQTERRIIEEMMV